MPSSRRGCISPPSPFWSLQVLLQRHQCRWVRRPAGSLAPVSPGEVGLQELPSYSVRCVAEAARCQLDQFERSTLWWVPRLANFVAMFGQFVETPCNFPMLRAIVTAVSLTTFGNIERPKMWNRQLQMVGLWKVICKRSGNKLPSFFPHRPLLSTPGASAKTPVPMGPQTCWKSCATLPWTSWTLRIALKFRPLRGSEFPMAHGQHCVMQTASPGRSCTASVAATSRGCFRCRGWMRRLRCR